MRHSLCKISMFGKDKWEQKLRELIESKAHQLTPTLARLIKRYGLTALAMDDFFQQLQKESKSTPYPTSLLSDLLKKSETATKI